MATKSIRPRLSLFFVGLLLFLAVDGLARLSFPLWKPKVLQRHAAEPVWQIVSTYNSKRRAPSVVMMGSSLVMAAVDSADAVFLQQMLDSRTHFQYCLLQHKLETALRSPVDVFACATSGQFVSDAYLLSSTLFVGPRKPDVLVYGIGPRDFMDNLLKSPVSTEPFRCLNRMFDLSDVALIACQSSTELIDFLAARLSFLYANREELAAFTGIKSSDSPEKTDGKTMTVFAPHDCLSSTYTDNLNEYRYRYAPFKKRIFRTQSAFFSKLAVLCKQRGIRLVVVNMPLTRENLSVMPEGFYKRYEETVASVCKKYSIPVLDLNNGAFRPGMFFDSVHLNGHGAQVFTDKLCDALVTDTCTRHAIMGSSRRLASSISTR